MIFTKISPSPFTVCTIGVRVQFKTLLLVTHQLIVADANNDDSHVDSNSGESMDTIELVAFGQSIRHTLTTNIDFACTKYRRSCRGGVHQ
jgi:hypothetical protein